jgi:glycosyltransferase involved in cell wall biosynthesis
MLISIIVATYNWPAALNLCIQSLLLQNDKEFEIIIADDGSKKDTEELVREFQKKIKDINLKYIWHEDLGFRKTSILNKAIKMTTGEYIIFLDGDCIAQPDFIEKHRMLSEEKKLVTGSRILLNKSLTQKLCDETYLNFKSIKTRSLFFRLSGRMNKFMPLWIKLPSSMYRTYNQFVWRRIKGCNLATWKNDIVAVNGFSEDINGWGHEDADLVFRMSLSGVKRKSGAWCTEVLHLYHTSNNKSQDKINLEIVKKRILQLNPIE